ncbi:MAG: DUF6544 family protein [Pseudomonadota bacterium]
MKIAVFVVAATLALILLGLGIWRATDHRADRREATRLLALRHEDPPRFSKDMVKDLPEPARRFFHFAIQDGTPLHRVAEISMTGQFGMGTATAPNYLPMTAEQVLAAPGGFIWKMSAGRGAMRVSGSDTAGWTRFWLAGLVPVARTGGTADHALSGFGRAISEAVFWTPAAVLPGPGVVWSAVDDSTARVTVEHGSLRQSVDVTVNEDGRPERIVFQRWSDANAEKEFRLQPFGGTLSAFRAFEGFMLPTHVEAGNFFGTEDYFAFFIADVTAVRFAP